MTTAKRCSWCERDALYRAYHDEEWGRPIHDDRRLFELLVLESFQAGLSWYTILAKREGFRTTLDGFDYRLIAAYDDAKVEALMQDTRIVRNRRKILATIQNAALFMEIQQEFGSFSEFIWAFVGGSPCVNHPRKLEDVPASTPTSDAIAKELKRRGFKFIGSTVAYAFMQAVGLVNDHVEDCAFKYPD